MGNIELVSAVETFARSVKNLPDTVLEHENWHWRAYEGVRYAFLQTYLELRTLAVTTAVRRTADGPAITPAQRILAQYQIAYRALLGVFSGVENEELDRTPANGEWPLRRVLGHIIDVEKAFYMQIHYALDQQRHADDRSLKKMSEAAEAQYHLQRGESDHGTMEEILARYEEFHKQILDHFTNICEEDLHALSLWWENEKMEIRFRLHRFDAHLREHTIQVEKVLVGIGHPSTEIARLIQMIYEALGEVEGALIGSWECNSEQIHESAVTIRKRACEMADLPRD